MELFKGYLYQAAAEATELEADARLVLTYLIIKCYYTNTVEHGFIGEGPLDDFRQYTGLTHAALLVAVSKLGTAQCVKWSSPGGEDYLVWELLPARILGLRPTEKDGLEQHPKHDYPYRMWSIWRRTDITGLEKSVLSVIMTEAREWSHPVYARVPVERFMQLLRCDESSLKRTLQSLVDNGLMRVWGEEGYSVELEKQPPSNGKAESGGTS